MISDGAVAVGSAVAGGMIGNIVGKPSLGVGLAAVAGGLFLEKKFSSKPYGKILLFAAAGMIANNGSSATEPAVSGFDGISDAKEKAIAYLKGIGKRTYIDKVSPAVATKLGLGDLDDLSYYTGEEYSYDVDGMVDGMDMSGMGALADSTELKGIDAGDLLNGSADITELTGLSASY